MIGGPAAAVGSGGAPSGNPARRSGPRRSGSPGQRIDRDAGIEREARDGSLLWLFGDSSEVDVNGEPAVLREQHRGLGRAGLAHRHPRRRVRWRPVQFAGAGRHVDLSGGRSRTRPAGRCPGWPGPWGHDRVTVFMANVCLGGSLQIEERGVSLVEWTYDPASPPDGVPVTATLVSDRLFTEADRAYGTAAVLDDAGRINAYACDRPADGSGLPQEYGPCRVARVQAANVANRGSWTYWNGGSWVAAIGSAAPMTLPDGVGGYPGTRCPP